MKHKFLVFIFMFVFMFFHELPVFAKSDELVVIFSGDNAGSIEPCGCSPQKGGLARRAAYIEKIRRENENVLAIDCGDMFIEDKIPAEHRAKTIAKAIGLMKYDAVNVGETELAFGSEFFKNIILSNNLPYVSANIKMADKSADKIIKSFVIKDFGNFKIGITGITEPAYITGTKESGKAVIAYDMVKSLKNTLSVMDSAGTAFNILLSHTGHEASVNNLKMNNFESVYIAISGHDRHRTFDPVMIKTTFLVQNSLSGESLGVLKIKLGKKNLPESCFMEDVTLKDTMPEDSRIARLVKIFEAESDVMEGNP